MLVMILENMLYFGVVNIFLPFFFILKLDTFFDTTKVIMFNCVVEVLSVDNVPSSVFGGRPNLIIQMGLIAQPNQDVNTTTTTTADFLPKCKATQRSTVLPHAPTSVTTDEVFRFVGCDEKEMLLVSIHDRDLDTPKGFVGYTQVPVGGPGKMHGLRSFKFTTDLGLLTGSPTTGDAMADPSPTTIQLLWRIDEADTPAAEGLSSRWESQYQQRVQEVHKHSTARTVTSIEDSVPAHVGQADQQQAASQPADLTNNVKEHRSYPLPTPMAPLQATSLNTSVADASSAPHQAAVEQPAADVGTKEDNPYYPYPASMFNVPALSPEKMTAPPAATPTEQQPADTVDSAATEGGEDVANTVDAVATKRPVKKDTCLDGCTALQAILSAPTRRLTAEEEVLVVAYEGPLLACTTGGRAEVPQMLSGGSTIGNRHIIGRLPVLTPHHGMTLEGAAFFSNSAAATSNAPRISTSLLATASCHKSQASLSIAMAPTAAPSAAAPEQQNLRPRSTTSPVTHTGILRPSSGGSVLRSRSKSGGGPAWEKSVSNQATGVRLTSTSLTSGPARW